MANISAPDFVVPSWFFLVLGLYLGKSSATLSIISILDAFKDVVNVLLVPIYAFCVVGYLVSLIWRDLERRRPTKSSKALAVKSHLPTIKESTEDGEVNLSGSYKLVKNDNFDGFLEVQGVPWALRRAADAARPTHTITHSGKTITIQIRGIIESETTYQIDGPPVETNIRGRVFRDQMKYLDSGDGIRVCKEGITEDYNVETIRQLSADKMSITMTSKAIFKDDRADVVCVQRFERIQ